MVEITTLRIEGMLKYVKLNYFFISFFLGLLYVYISSPEYEYITVYPTQDNKDKFQFQDRGYNCFTLESAVVDCSEKAEELPVQV